MLDGPSVYLGKLLWPADLILSIPAGKSAKRVVQYLFPCCAHNARSAMESQAAWRGPLPACSFLSHPVSGARFSTCIRYYSYVADHFSTAGLGVITLVSAGARSAWALQLGATAGTRMPRAAGHPRHSDCRQCRITPTSKPCIEPLLS